MSYSVDRLSSNNAAPFGIVSTRPEFGDTDHSFCNNVRAPNNRDGGADVRVDRFSDPSEVSPLLTSLR